MTALKVKVLFGILLAFSARAAVYEAEDAAITSGSIKADAGASNGSYVDGNGGFNLTWNVDTSTGDKTLTFRIKVPSGDRTMGIFVNGVQAGTVNSASTGWEEKSVEAVMVDGINTLELRDSEGTAELDVDYVFVSNKTLYRYEAEDMALTGFSVQSNDVASGSHFIQIVGGGTGTAVQVFGGYDGEYHVDTHYMDETDGICSYELRVDGIQVDSWLADGTFGTTGVSAASLTFHRTSSVALLNGSVIELEVVQESGEPGRVDVMELALVNRYATEAEDMLLDGYAVETNSAASGGLLAVLQGGAGSVSEVLAGLASGYYDLTVAYFDETDGEAAFRIYLNDLLIDSWLADRMLGSAEPLGVNRMERTVKKVYLRAGDTLEISAIADGGESAGIDGYTLQSAAASAGVSMTWNTDGSIASLELSGAEHIDSTEDSGVILRVFDGYSLDTLEQYSAEQTGSWVEIHEDELDYARFYFRMDEFEHHIVLRLIGMDGVPREDPSLSLRLEIPYTTLPGYQLLDGAVSVETSGGVLELDWNQLSTRGLLAGGQIALYAASDASAALAEIEQVHTANGNLDDYYAWIGGFPITGTDADLFADPDGDGINNLSEYALGGVPTLESYAVLPESGMIGSEFAVQYNRRLDAEQRGLIYTVKAADDLINPDWTTNGVSLAGVEIIDAEFESVTNRVSTAGTTTTSRFLKLDVEITK